jgi:hypothetical protein
MEITNLESSQKQNRDGLSTPVKKLTYFLLLFSLFRILFVGVIVFLVFHVIHIKVL